MNRDWLEQAACDGVDPELFFPDDDRLDGVELRAQVAAAKAVCAGCEVRHECLDFALAAVSHGIAGGLTAEERNDLLRTEAPNPRRSWPAPLMPGATRASVSAAGAELLVAGESPRAVAQACGVAVTTAQRWKHKYKESVA